MPFWSLPNLDLQVWVVIAGVFGLAIGSFLNVVIHRLPRIMEADWRAQCAELAGAPAPETAPYTLARPRSACPACGHRISALENIPIVSWLALRGRCSACRAAISARYPAVELLTALLSAAAIAQFGATLAGLGALCLIWTLIALAFIDLDTQYLPDDLTVPLLWLGLVFSVLGNGIALTDAVIGAVAGYAVLWIVNTAFRLIRGIDGMGYGDFKLLAALGAWLGWQMLPLIVLVASVSGALVGIALVLFVRHDRRTPIPFGPYLVSGGLIALFWGPTLVAVWLGNAG